MGSYTFSRHRDALMSAPKYCRVAKEEDKASSVSPLAAPSVSNSLEETQLLETPPENDGTK